MISERIKELRERSNLSQSELARRLSISRASVNAWESGISAPTAIFLIELADVFHVSTDYILGINNQKIIDVSSLTSEELKIVYSLLDYFDKSH